MATIYQKISTDKALILAVREALVYPFDLGTWTDLRIGMWLSMTTAGADNAQSTSETVTIANSPLNVSAIGIKNSSNQAVPYQTGSVFAGYVSTNALSGGSAVYSSGSSQSYLGQGYIGTVYGTTTNLPGLGATNWIAGFTASTASTLYCYYMGFKFVLNNRGLATQTIDVFQENGGTLINSAYYTSDPSVSSIVTKLETPSYVASSGPVSLNDAGAALTVPNALFIRLPFYNNRIRIHSLAIMRYT